jgi:hypothetical protein
VSDDDQPLAAYICAMPGNRFSSRGVLLAFGQKPDATIVHVDHVRRGLACGCVLPAVRNSGFFIRMGESDAMMTPREVNK